MARAMPVISISRPRNTNSGIDSRIRCDMPSSMRLTMTVERRARRQRHVADGRERRTQNAIGTPAYHQHGDAENEEDQRGCSCRAR